MTEFIGWFSSLILIATIGKQVYKQWKEGKSGGVSKWLYAGQIAASAGFAIYSYLVGNWVFIFTNSVMVLNGVAGFLINRHLKRREEKQGNAQAAAA
jgi:MtN3 and saliva related transmembrane protein